MKRKEFIVIAGKNNHPLKRRLSDETLNKNYWENIEINLSEDSGIQEGHKIRVILEDASDINLREKDEKKKK